MEENAPNIIPSTTMGNYLIMALLKFSPAILVFSYFDKEKQQEAFNIIKTTGIIKQGETGIPIASAFKATIEERYESKVQMNQPITINTN